MSSIEALRVPPPLPETRQNLLEQYTLKRRRSINDLVEEVFVKLWEEEDFQSYLNAIYDSASQEGSMEDDDIMAAQMIRERAIADKHVEVAQSKLHTIKLAMRVCQRRFQVGRYERYEQGKLPLPEAPAQSSLPAE
jgi:hypothetical protein